MSADKRTPHTDALETLGKIHQYAEKRDAIHLGVEPVVAAHKMYPGDNIGIDEDGRASKYAMPLLGIVDPFLTDAVTEGQAFWLVVYPRQITSLRHVWEHPNFPKSGETGEEVKAENPHAKPRAKALLVEAPPPPPVKSDEEIAQEIAVAWIREYADGYGLDYDELMQAAEDYLDHGSYLVKGGDLEGCYVSDEFWDNFELAKRQRVYENDRGSFFSCSC